MPNKHVSIGLLADQQLDIGELTGLQGELKTLENVNFARLKRLIDKHGYSFKVHAWQAGDVNYIIDGHQRVAVLKAMREEGYEVPKIPVAFVKAENFEEAQELVGASISQFGTVQKDGFLDFFGDEFNFDNMNIPGFEIPNFDPINPDELDPESAFDKLKEGDRSDSETSQITLTFMLREKEIVEGFLKVVINNTDCKNNSEAMQYVLSEWCEANG